MLCILGESGSGKSVTMRALMRLLPKFAHVTGSIEVGGRDVVAMNEGQLQDFRGGDVAMIFQEPMTALDPVFTVGRQIAETVQRHEGVSRAAGDGSGAGIAGAGADPVRQAAARRPTRTSCRAVCASGR